MSEELTQAVPEMSTEAASVRAADSEDLEVVRRKLELIQQDNRTKARATQKSSWRTYSASFRIGSSRS